MASGSAWNSSSSSSSASAGPAEPPEHHRQIGARAGEARRDLQRPPEQRLGIAQPADPRGKLGQHPHRPDVERVVLEMRLEDPLGEVEAVVMHRHRRLDEPRMPALRSWNGGDHGRGLSAPGRLAPSRRRGYAGP